MWKKLLDAGLLFSRLGDELERNKPEIKEMRIEHRAFARLTEEKIRELREVVQRLAFEMQRDRENAAHEREKLELRMEIRRRDLQGPLPSAPGGTGTALPPGP